MIDPELLACPCCRSPLRLDVIAPPAGGLDVFGVLSSACGRRHPVVDGIPIVMPEVGHVGAAGEDESLVTTTAEEILRRVEAHETVTLLADLLAVPWCPWPLSRLRTARRTLAEGPIGRLNALLRSRALRRRLRRPDPGTAQEWLARFHESGVGGSDAYSYFFHRFAQPRHLAALALLATLRDDERPVVDVACGYGHLTHFLVHRRPVGGAIGVDVSFSAVWLAKRLIAPGAAFVCADASGVLPLRDDVAAAVVCSDAFHYLPDAAAALGELARCTAGGPIVLPRFGNVLVEPNEGHEHDPAGWAHLLGRVGAVRLRAEDDLVTEYLADVGPRLAEPATPGSLDAAKWLYAVIDPSGASLIDHDPPPTRPHLAGELGINPIYRRTTTRGAHRLRFTWPSPWYAYENARMADYHADRVTLERQAPATPRPATASLVDRFVLIGLPPGYVATLRRRPAQRVRAIAGKVRDRVRRPR